MARGSTFTKTPEDLKMDMTPIIDVVFNLLIFFMLTLDFKDEEGILNANLPHEGICSSNNTPKLFEEIRIHIQKKNESDHTIVILGRKVIPDPVENPSQLISNLTRLMAINPKNPVIIDPSKKAEFKYVMTVLNSCKFAGVQEIKFATPSF